MNTLDIPVLLIRLNNLFVAFKLKKREFEAYEIAALHELAGVSNGAENDPTSKVRTLVSVSRDATDDMFHA